MKVLITGASRGIGSFLMNKLFDHGYLVYGTFNQTQPRGKLEQFYTKVDVSKYTQVNEWVDSTVSIDDKIVLINCAGINYNTYAHKADSEKWKKVIEVNLLGSFYPICAVLPYMRKVGFGRIINLSSILAQKGVPGTSAYASSKSALWGMSKSIAVENAEKGITINSLNLGYFSIGMIEEVPKQIISSIKTSTPVKEIGKPENILNAVKFLIETEYITGATIDINGGLL